MENLFLISTVLLWLAVLFNLVLTLALIRRFSKFLGRSDFEMPPALEIGTPAPDFSAETLDGKLVTLASYARQTLAFIFVSPTCTPCIENIPTIQSIQPQAKRKGVELILVSLADQTETRAFVDKYSIKVPILVAPQGSNSFTENYKVPGTPFYCLLDKEGKVQSTGVLDSKWKDLTQEWSVAV
jgi:methylamine dehydrogenase accessory protein MauD